MADKRKDQQNGDTLKTIFDFIFAETQKVPEKRRPVRFSHVDGASELTDVLTTVLEKPGLYVSDQAMDVLKDTLNVQLAEIYTGTGAPQKKVKIGTTDLVSIFKDPNGYFDKLYEKNKRKLTLADYAGKSFRGILAASVAKEMGVDSWEDQWAINRIAGDYEAPEERLAIVQESRRAAKKYLALDAFVAGSESAFGSNVQNNRQLIADLGKRIDSANIQNATQLRNLLVNDPSISNNIQAINEIMNQYYRKESNFYNKARGSIANADLLGGNGVKVGDLQNLSDWEKLLHKGFKDRLDRFSPENIDMAKDINTKYFQTKASIYRYSGDSADRTQAQAYDEMALLLQNLKKTQDHLIKQKTNSLERVKANIRRLESLPMLTPTQQEYLVNFKKLEKTYKKELTYLEVSSPQDKYYRALGYYKSMKEIWGKNLGASILDGTFFSDDNKILNPVRQTELGLHMVGDDKIFFNIHDKDNAYCRTMTTIMYLTPKKLLQFDGTYFAYRAYLNRMDSFNKLISQVKGLGNKDLLDALYRDIEETNLFARGPNGRLLINYEAFKDPAQVRAAIAELKMAYGDDPDIAALLDRYLQKEGSLSKLVSTFSFFSRFKENIKRKIDDATLGAIRKKIGDNLLLRFGGDVNLESAIKLWQGGGGIQNMVKGFVDKFLVEKGFRKIALTTVSQFLTTAISNLSFQMYIILAKVLVVALVGVIFLIGMGVSSFNTMTQRYNTVSNVTPGEVEQCEGFESEELVNTGDTNIVVPPPSNSSCPLGSASYYCTQGPNGSFSHHGINNKRPVDIALHGSSFYFYAPQYCDNGGCRITVSRSAAQWRCLDHSVYVGDEVIFNDGQGNEFIIVHAKALVPIQQEVSGGEAVAYIYGAGELSNAGTCWDGSHLHLEITHNGAYIDPLPFLQAMGCSVPGTSQCPE